MNNLGMQECFCLSMPQTQLPFCICHMYLEFVVDTVDYNIVGPQGSMDLSA